jgi:Fe-S oxidoreductase
MQIQARQFAQEYGLFACIQCGKCTGGCPVSAKTTLNIREVIYHLLTSENGFKLDGFDELWDCTTCNTCTSRCPKEVDPMEVMIGLRSAVVEGGRIPNTVKVALQSVFTQGNPLTFSREDRAAWVGDLPVRFLGDEPGAEFLYFVGCTPSYDPRIQKITRALVRAFDTAGVEFGILGREENCCGSEVRRLGEAGLFEMLVEENMELWKEYGIRQVVTTSPHCYNTLKRDYPQGVLQVMHYTELVAQLLQQGRLALSGSVDARVTYHDPCYLGKHNGIFDAPRSILKRIPGLKFVEMDRSRERSLCCEGGGGRMWLEGTNIEERLAHQRVQEAIDTGAEILATACPFCVLTLEDAVKTRGLEDQIRVLDLMELVAAALQQ